MLGEPPSAAQRSIVTVTSASAGMVSPDRAAYCCSKAALSTVVKIFALRLADAGIGCYELRPGIIRTEMTHMATEKYDRLIEQGLIPMPRWGAPEDVGRAAAALAAGEFSYMTGDALHVDGGLHIQRL